MRRNTKRRFGRRYRPKTGVSYSKVVKLSYQDATTPYVTITAGTKFAFREYRLNSAYDFDIQLLSDAAIGYKEWAAFYRRYLVTYVSLTCTFINPTPSAVWVGIMFRPVTGETNWTEWLTWRMIKSQNFPHRMMMLSPAGGKSDRVTLNVKCPLWKLHGRRGDYNGDADFSADVDANPARQLDGLVFCLSPDGNVATAPVAVYTNISATLYVKFYQQKTLRSSNTFDANDDGGLPAEEIVPLG